ncbi:transposase family protein [Streptomyces sp. NPDC026665]|uniref:transposase family protein n=1 Tax=Streptomyces sp. NPDC026665 TaxID=3154798 RepID=UPI0033D5E1A4
MRNRRTALLAVDMRIPVLFDAREEPEHLRFGGEWTRHLRDHVGSLGNCRRRCPAFPPSLPHSYLATIRDRFRFTSCAVCDVSACCRQRVASCSSDDARSCAIVCQASDPAVNGPILNRSLLVALAVDWSWRSEWGMRGCCLRRRRRFCGSGPLDAGRVADLRPYLDLVPDRAWRGRWYSLTAVLLVCAWAAVSRARSLDELAEWTERAPDVLLAAVGIRRHLLRWRRAPSRTTIGRVLKAVDGDALDRPGSGRPSRRPP